MPNACRSVECGETDLRYRLLRRGCFASTSMLLAPARAISSRLSIASSRTFSSWCMLFFGVSPPVFSEFMEKEHHGPRRILDPQRLTLSVDNRSSQWGF